MFEAYKVAVKITLVNEVSAGILAISRQFGQAGRSVTELQKRLDTAHASLKKWGIIGAAGAGLAYGTFKFMDGPIKAARDYTEELVYMRDQAGLTADEIDKIRGAATNVSRSIPVLSDLSAMKGIMDLRSIFGAAHLQMAIGAMPAVAKAQSILGQMGVKDADEQVFTIAKTLELLGHGKDVSDFTKHLNLMVQGMQAFHAKVLPRDWLNTVTYLRATKYGFSDDFLYKYLPAFMLEYKGSGGSGGARGPGNAITSMIANVAFGQLSQKSFRVWQQLGLVNPGAISHVRGHGYVMKSGGIVGTSLFQQNPFAWTEQYLLPALKKANITNLQDVLRIIAYLVPNRTSQDILSQIVTQAWKFERDKENIVRATGLAGFEKLLKESPELAMQRLNAQWFNVQYRLAFDTLPKLIDGVNWLSQTIAKVSAYLENHRGAANGIMYGLGGLFTLGVATTIASIVGSLATLAKLAPVLAISIGALVKTLGALGASLGVGYAAGSGLNWLINKGLSKATGHDTSLGSVIYDLFNPAYDPNATSTKTIRTGRGTVVVQNHIYVDGKEVAHHMVGPANNTGTTSMNPGVLRPAPANPARGY